MAKTFEAHDKLIEEIFGGSYQFEIPEYQRPYAWTVDQTAELFDDLCLAMRDARDSQGGSQYFLGSIVLIKKDRDAKSSVVDGQQRLTTLTILFAVLRIVMPEAADDITTFLYNKGKVSLGETNEYRLIAREEDADFFRANIQEPSGVAQLIASTDKLEDSRLRYRENADLLLKMARALSPDDCKDLWKFLAKNCSLIVISTPDLEAAYRIFSVLNNRGLDLAPIDIIKAEVLGLIRKTKGEESSRDYAKKWSDIESSLGRGPFGDLFGHIRSIYAKKKQQHTLIKEFQEHVTEYKAPGDLIDKVIKPYAEVWGIVRGTDFEATEHAEKINERLSWLGRVDFKDWVPPALVYFKRFRRQSKLLAEFFQALERLTYFMLVAKVRPNGRIATYAALTKEIESDSFDGQVVALEALTLKDTQKREFVAALDGNIYRDLSEVRMALVLRLESLLRDPGVKLQDAVSLEHVLPQTPPVGSQWLLWFPNEDERQTWTHRLANLVLLDRRKNSSASNDSFANKKEEYFKGKKSTASPFVLTQEVRSEAIWTPETLDRRQKRLVGVLSKHWDLD